MSNIYTPTAVERNEILAVITEIPGDDYSGLVMDKLERVNSGSYFVNKADMQWDLAELRRRVDLARKPKHPRNRRRR